MSSWTIDGRRWIGKCKSCAHLSERVYPGRFIDAQGKRECDSWGYFVNPNDIGCYDYVNKKQEQRGRRKGVK